MELSKLLKAGYILCANTQTLSRWRVAYKKERKHFQNQRFYETRKSSI
jgi:hypothetical protein